MRMRHLRREPKWALVGPGAVWDQPDPNLPARYQLEAGTVVHLLAEPWYGWASPDDPLAALINPGIQGQLLEATNEQLDRTGRVPISIERTDQGELRIQTRPK